VTARPLALGFDCVFGAYTGTALSWRSRRVRLDLKHPFTGGAASVGSDGWP
jgi:hypothetical protein